MLSRGYPRIFCVQNPRIPDNLPDAQQGKRDGAEDHPDAHGLFARQVGIKRAGAAEQENAHEPGALQALGREAEAVDIEHELGQGDDGEEHTLDQKRRRHPADRLAFPPGGARDEPEEGEVDRHDAAELEEALAGVLRDREALRERPRERAEQISALHEEKREIERAEHAQRCEPDGLRHDAQPRQRGLCGRAASAHRLGRFAAKAREQAEDIGPDGKAEEKAIEPHLIEIECQRVAQSLQKLTERIVRSGQLRHGHDEQHQHDECGQHGGCDGSGVDLPLLFGLQREQHAADAQEEIFEWDDHKRIQRVERQQMAAFAAGQPPGTAHEPIDGEDMQDEQQQFFRKDIFMVDKLRIARIVLVRVQPAPGDAAGHKQHAAKPDPAFPGTLLLPEQILRRRDKSGGEQRQRPPLIAQIEICQHIQSERQQLLSPVCGKRRLFRHERVLRPIGCFRRAGEFVDFMVFHREPPVDRPQIPAGRPAGSGVHGTGP